MCTLIDGDSLILLNNVDTVNVKETVEEMVASVPEEMIAAWQEFKNSFGWSFRQKAVSHLKPNTTSTFMQ